MTTYSVAADSTTAASPQLFKHAARIRRPILLPPSLHFPSPTDHHTHTSVGNHAAVTSAFISNAICSANRTTVIRSAAGCRHY